MKNKIVILLALPVLLVASQAVSGKRKPGSIVELKGKKSFKIVNGKWKNRNDISKELCKEDGLGFARPRPGRPDPRRQNALRRIKRIHEIKKEKKNPMGVLSAVDSYLTFELGNRYTKERDKLKEQELSKTVSGQLSPGTIFHRKSHKDYSFWEKQAIKDMANAHKKSVEQYIAQKLYQEIEKI